jgi:hypothetical protein
MFIVPNLMCHRISVVHSGVIGKIDMLESFAAVLKRFKFLQNIQIREMDP